MCLSLLVSPHYASKQVSDNAHGIALAARYSLESVQFELELLNYNHDDDNGRPKQLGVIPVQPL